MRSDDFREELLSAKKAHQLALRENAHFRTRLRIAESECRRREAEIERILKAQANDGTAEGKSPKARIEIACLRRKVLLYERMLHEKSAENEKLITDKGVTQAAETRKMVNRLESECQRLRSHLAESVPESEFLREKEQYTVIINKLVEENMHLRNVIGEFEQRRKESERIIAQFGGSDALVRQFRQTAISSRRQANFYKKALGNLIKRKGNGSREIVSVGQESGKDGEISQRVNGTRESKRSENTNSKQSEERVRNTSKNRETSERKLVTENDQKEMIYTSEKEEGKNGAKNRDGEEKIRQKRSAEGDRLLFAASRSSSTPLATSPRGAVLPLNRRVSSNASLSKVNNEEQRVEEEEEEEQEKGEEEKEIEESQMNALFRVLHSHILRQQMLKVRRERDDCPNFVGMDNFY